MFSFRRKKRCSYDLTVDHDLETEQGNVKINKNSLPKKESFTYHGLNSPLEEESQNKNGSPQHPTSKESSPVNPRASSSDKTPDCDSSAVLQDSLTQSAKEKSKEEEENKNAEIIREAKGEEETKRDSNENKFGKKEARTSLLDEVLAETSNLSISSQEDDSFKKSDS